MYYITFLFPLIGIAVAVAMGVDLRESWGWAVGLVLAAEGLIYLLLWLFRTAREYLSGYVARVEYFYPWVERVVTYVTRTDSNGRSYTEQKVSFVHHPAEWYEILSTGMRLSGAPDRHEWFKNAWQNVDFFTPCHPNCVSGGGAERCVWDGMVEHTHPRTYIHRYRNYVRHSSSIFGALRIGRKQAKGLGLVKYPSVGYDQDALIVAPGASCGQEFGQWNYSLRLFNAFLGSRHQIHLFVILYPADKGQSIARDQRDYWKGFNKNEYVVCLGVDDGGKVGWCHADSWMDDKTLHVATADYFAKHPQLDIDAFVGWIKDNIALWKRKEFKDFKYLGTHMSTSQAIVYWVLALAFGVLVAWVMSQV